MRVLEQGLKNDGVLDISEGERATRSDALGKLSRDLRKYQSRFSEGTKRETASPADTDTSTGYDEEMVMQREPSHLDYIMGTVVNLKDLGYEINEEIDVQCRLIESIESKEDEILNKTRYNHKKLDEYLKEKTVSLASLWTIVIVLFMMFLFVLVY